MFSLDDLCRHMIFLWPYEAKQQGEKKSEKKKRVKNQRSSLINFFFFNSFQSNEKRSSRRSLFLVDITYTTGQKLLLIFQINRFLFIIFSLILSKSMLPTNFIWMSPITCTTYRSCCYVNVDTDGRLVYTYNYHFNKKWEKIIIKSFT